MSHHHAETRRDAASTSQTSRRRVDHCERRHGGINARGKDLRARPRINHPASLKRVARHTQRRQNARDVSRDQVEFTGDVEGQAKELTPMTAVDARAVETKTPLTRNQLRGFWAAWGGWALDGMDSFIYALVMVPALRELLPRSGIPGDQANVGYYGGLLFALFLIGWGLSLVWGPIADKFGRVRT